MLQTMFEGIMKDKSEILPFLKEHYPGNWVHSWEWHWKSSTHEAELVSAIYDGEQDIYQNKLVVRKIEKVGEHNVGGPYAS